MSMVPEAAVPVMILSDLSRLSRSGHILGSKSCKRAKESKHSSDNIEMQLELSELEVRDPGATRSHSSM